MKVDQKTLLQKTHGILQNNNIIADFRTPTLIIFRNTGLNGEYVEDTGENATDLFFFFTPSNYLIVPGRSKPNQSYIDRFMKNGRIDPDERFNYIAPGYYPDAQRKGLHKNKPAYAQNRKFAVIRSYNSIFGDNDDYASCGLQFDNLHGYLKSLGCLVVAGDMGRPGDAWNRRQLSGDWKKVYNWGFITNSQFNTLNVLICTRYDFVSPAAKRLRFGSNGTEVKKLQRLLNKNSRSNSQLSIDGDFGFLTLEALVKYQHANPTTYKTLGVYDYEAQ